ncbi:MAG TPA: DUF4328 domain-containing protein [Bacteroidia bacterium]|jgi:hypothetical protein|nr:DUF4328 domain-containing protein [Bacteroidia bacterium]
MQNPLERNRSRANFAIITLWLILPFILLSAASYYYLVTTIYRDGGVFINPILDNMEWQKEIAFGRLIILIITGISFASWMSAAYRNLKVLQQHELSYSPSTAFVGWFIPLANLFIPPKMLSEIWKFTPDALNEKRTAAEKEKDEVSPIGAWWFFYLMAGAGTGAGIFLTSIKGWGGDVYNYKGGWIGLAGCACDLVALFTAMYMVREISRRETALYERVQQQLDSGELEFASGEEEEKRASDENAMNEEATA